MKATTKFVKTAAALIVVGDVIKDRSRKLVVRSVTERPDLMIAIDAGDSELDRLYLFKPQELVILVVPR